MSQQLLPCKSMVGGRFTKLICNAVTRMIPIQPHVLRVKYLKWVLQKIKQTYTTMAALKSNS